MGDVHDAITGEMQNGLTRDQLLRRGLAAGLGAAGVLAGLDALPAFAASDAAEAKNITLSFLTNSNAAPGTVGGDAYAKVFAEYHKKHPHVTVRYDVIPQATFLAGETARYKTGALEDIVEQLPAGTYAPIFPALLPLTPTTVGPLYKTLTGWGEALSHPRASTSRFFGVPAGTVGFIYYYNKAAFKKAGLPTGHPPATWSEFANACNALKAKGITPIAADGAENYTPWWMWQTASVQFYPHPSDAAKFGTGQHKITGAAMRKSLEVILHMVEKGWFGSDWLGKSFDIQNDFQDGKTAMICGLTGGFFAWDTWDKSMGHGTYGAFSLPKLPGTPKASAAHPKQAAMVVKPLSVYSISKKSKHHKEALAFVEYLSSKKVQSTLFKIAARIPNRNDVPFGSLSHSAGAQAVDAILRKHVGRGAPQDYFAGATFTTALQNLGTALNSGKIDTFLQQLEQAQSGQ